MENGKITARDLRQCSSKCHHSTKSLVDLGWPSYWTHYTKSATDFAEDKRGSYVEKNMTPVYIY